MGSPARWASRRCSRSTSVIASRSYAAAPQFRRTKAADRLHLVEGLLIAILDIDEVIQLIRSSDTRAEARERLISVFDLSELQADFVLDRTLGSLTRLSKIELDKEADELRAPLPTSTRSSGTSRCSARWRRAQRDGAAVRYALAALCFWSLSGQTARQQHRSRSPTTRAGRCCRPPG